MSIPDRVPALVASLKVEQASQPEQSALGQQRESRRILNHELHQYLEDRHAPIHVASISANLDPCCISVVFAD